MFVATINTPGYLPWDDDPPVFDTAREAWSYLRDERERDEDGSSEEGEAYSGFLTDLTRVADDDALWDGERFLGDWVGVAPTGEGSLWGPSVVDKMFDLGLAYNVDRVEDDGLREREDRRCEAQIVNGPICDKPLDELGYCGFERGHLDG